LVVVTGGRIYIQNTRLNTVNSYDLSDFPLGILLDDNINLMRNPAIRGVEEQQNALVVHARTSANQNQSNITLIFSYPQIELRQWMVKDNQGGVTTVALNGLATGMPLDDALFAAPQKAPSAKNR
jgi:outer membrane lipoprotein-sorting protein